MKFEIRVSASFSAAHRVKRHTGEIEDVHGHNYRVEVFIAGDKLDENGMLVDFGVVKRELKKVLDTLDHSFLNEHHAFKGTYPTAENIALFIYKSLSKQIDNELIRVSRVSVWETDSSYASFIP